MYLPAYYVQADQINYRNRLYRNNGNGSFTDVSMGSGTDNGNKATMISVWFDYDNDLWPDLFVLNDRSIYENALYKNNSGQDFSDITSSAGVNYAVDAMTGTVGDFNNDGWFDVYITNTFPGPSLLHVNQGNGQFLEQAAQQNATIGQSGWGAVWIDYDNDMLQDLMVATFEGGNNMLMRNLGANFQTIQNSGIYDLAATFSYSMGDIDNDGFPDLASYSKSPIGVELWQNQTAGNNYLKVKLQGTLSNRMGIGSKIELVTADGTHQYRYTMCGDQYLSQNSASQFFGLATNESADTLRITWPSGQVDEFYNVMANQSLVIAEGSSIENTISVSGPTMVCRGDSTLLAAGTWQEYLWSSGETTSEIWVTEGGAYSVSVYNGEFWIQSDTVNIRFVEEIYVEFLVESPTCYSDSTGSVLVQGDIKGAEIFWPELGSSGEFVESLAAGNYNCNITDVNGCEFEFEVLIEQPEELELHVTQNGTSEFCSSGQTIHFSASGGQEPYLLSWFLYLDLDASYVDAGIVTDSIVCLDLTDNYYLVTKLQDESDCFLLDTTLLIIGSASSLDAQLNQIQCRPNPAHDLVTFSGMSQVNHVALFDMLGHVVLEKGLVEGSEVSLVLEGITPGIYTAVLTGRAGKSRVLISKN